MEELNEEQLEELTASLQELEAELDAQLSTARDGARPVDLDEPIGRLSRMDAMQQQQMSMAHRGRLEVRLQQVRAALAKAERDDYGNCNVCQEPIGYARLRVKPESPMCVACQSKRERR